MNSMAILILAVIAGFLFYQLRSVLGQTPYDKEERERRKEKKPYEPYRLIDPQGVQAKTQEKIIETPISMTTNHKFIKGDSEIKTEITKTLNAIKENYKEFQLSEFLEGSKSAYNMIISAFEKNTLDSIKDFVSPDIFDEFNILRQSYNEKNYKYTNAITNIESAIVINAVTTQSAAQITIEIKSQNVIALEDENGDILHGDPKQIKMVTDVWTFERAFTSSSPAWILISK